MVNALVGFDAHPVEDEVNVKVTVPGAIAVTNPPEVICATD